MRTLTPTPPSTRTPIVPGSAQAPTTSSPGTLMRRLRRITSAGRLPGDLRRMVPAAPAVVVQERLVDAGLLAPRQVSRRWDRTTVTAVEDFQRARGLQVDGIAGPATVDLLLAA